LISFGGGTESSKLYAGVDVVVVARGIVVVGRASGARPPGALAGRPDPPDAHAPTVTAIDATTAIRCHDPTGFTVGNDLEGSRMAVARLRAVRAICAARDVCRLAGRSADRPREILDPNTRST
jgi:hypothetical protein